ncbi:MAG: RHS repeat domain-containing protein, partial [Spirochaetota bacterium]
RIKKEDLANGSTTKSTIDTALFAPGKKDTSGKNVAQWRYDGLGQLIETSDPDLGYSRAEYNAYGDVIKRTDAQSRVTVYSYDTFGRLSHKSMPNGEGEVSYSYDTGAENALGKLVAVEDPAQTKRMDYDKIGRVKHEERVIQNGCFDSAQQTYDTDFTYDLLNRTKSILYPVDPTTSERIKAEYTYGAMGVTGITLKQGLAYKTVVDDITYNEFGQMSAITRGNGSTTAYAYDARGRLKNLVTTKEDGTKIQNVTYDFNTNDSIAVKEDSTGEGEWSRKVRYEYSYDGLNRLVDAQGTAVMSGNTESAKKYRHGYSYASNGNILTKSIYTSASLGASASTLDIVEDRWNYSYTNHAVTSINSTKSGNRFAMNYDASGNMNYQADSLKKKTKEITYDSNNRITEVTDSAGKVVGQYEYDDQGFRVRKEAAEIINGAETKVEVLYPSMYFCIEKQKTPEGDDIQNTAYAVNNIYLNGVRIAASLPNGACQYYLTDQVDSVSLVTDDKSEVVTRTEYLPYGETWFQEGDKKNRPKFNSQELDVETGFYFFNARYQDPEICRFVTADNQIDGEYDTQGWNRYSYVKNNPVQYKDPTGHLGMDPFGGTMDGQSILSWFKGRDDGQNTVTNNNEISKKMNEAKGSDS